MNIEYIDKCGPSMRKKYHHWQNQHWSGEDIKEKTHIHVLNQIEFVLERQSLGLAYERFRWHTLSVTFVTYFALISFTISRFDRAKKHISCRQREMERRKKESCPSISYNPNAHIFDRSSDKN